MYLIFLRNTPEDYRPYALFFPWLRRKIVSLYINSAGKMLRVKSGAEISPNTSVGNYSELGTRCLIQANVVIGDYVIMGPDVKIYSRNHRFDQLDIPIQKQGKNKFRTTIGNDVWLASNSFILPGVTLPDGVVVTAGSIVGIKAYKPYAIISGNPARIIGYRGGKKP